MSAFIGTIGGFMMIVVVVALFMRFLCEIGVATFQKEDGKVIAAIVAAALLELFLCGLFCVSKGVDSSVLDVSVLFAEKGLLFEEYAPFNWYVGFALGVYTVFGVYRLMSREMMSIWMVMAIPLAWTIFLPGYASVIAAGVMFVIQVINRILSGRFQRLVGKVADYIFSQKARIVCDITFSMLTVASGYLMILFVRVNS